MINKKPIQITSLAMRFQLSQGWTLEILNQYLTKGELILKGFGKDEDEDQYYILRPYATLDVEGLVRDGHVGALLGRSSWGELETLTDLEVLKQRNW